MFEQITMVEGARRGNPWSFAASVTVQSVLVAAALTLPMLRIASIDTRLPDILVLPRSLGSHPPVKPAQGTASAGSAVIHAARAYRSFQAPSRIPARVATGPDAPDAPLYDIGGAAGGGYADSIAIGGFDELAQKSLPSPPPPEPARKGQQAAAQQAPLRVGGGVQSAKLVFGPRPNYPPLARQARIAGTVQLAARISADGHIRDLRVIGGHPMLVPAALAAVSQWIYKPTLLNGQPVEVLTDIVVNFTLSQ